MFGAIARDHRGGCGSKHAGRAKNLRIGNSRSEGMVTGGPLLLLIRVVVGLIQDDEADIRERGKQGAAGTNHDVQ